MKKFAVFTPLNVYVYVGYALEHGLLHGDLSIFPRPVTNNTIVFPQLPFVNWALHLPSSDAQIVSKTLFQVYFAELYF